MAAAAGFQAAVELGADRRKQFPARRLTIRPAQERLAITDHVPVFLEALAAEWWLVKDKESILGGGIDRRRATGPYRLSRWRRAAWAGWPP
jgi:hypothetical protein